MGMRFDSFFPMEVHGILSTVGLLDILDILLVAAILYKVYEMLQDTRAIALVKGFLVLMALAVFSNWANLHVISWLLQKHSVQFTLQVESGREQAGLRLCTLRPLRMLTRRQGKLRFLTERTSCRRFGLWNGLQSRTSH